MTTTWARNINGFAVDVVTQDPATLFHSDLVGSFVVVSNGTTNGAKLIDGNWVNQPYSTSTPGVIYPQVPPPQFYWLFTAEEQVQIEALKLSDPMVQLFFRRLDDPRLVQVDLNLASVQDAIKYVLNKIHVGGYAGRFDEIMTGVLR